MKCDHLIGRTFDGEVYILASDVMEAIAELKADYHAEVEEVCVEKTNVDTLEQVLKEKDKALGEKDALLNDFREMQRQLAEKCGRLEDAIDKKDDEIAELKAKLENVQTSMCCDVVDANMENRRLKRSLWLMTAEWAEGMGLASCNIAIKLSFNELKQKLHDAEMRVDIAEAANTEYRIDLKNIKYNIAKHARNQYHKHNRRTLRAPTADGTGLADYYLKYEADKVIKSITEGAISMFRDSNRCRGLDLESPLGRIANAAFKHWCFVESISIKNTQLQEDKERLLQNNHHLLDEVERLKEDVADARQKACVYQEIINEMERQERTPVQALD